MPNEVGSGTRSATESPSAVTANARRFSRSMSVSTDGSSANLSITGRCTRGGDDDELEALVGPASRITSSLAAERARDLIEKCTGTVEQHRMSWSLLGGREPGEEFGLGLRPDPGHRAEPSLGRGRAKPSTVLTPRADVTAIIRFAPTPSSRPKAMSSGWTVRSSSSSSAILPVATAHAADLRSPSRSPAARQRDH